jgi:hypothetical protein
VRHTEGVVESDGVPEEPLAGGNSTDVVRNGDTVRRAIGPWTPTIHALLTRLRAAGIDEVPAAHGIDDAGREVLDYLPGVVANYPIPAWVWSPEVLTDAGVLLRRVHDASVGVAVDGPWRTATHEPAEVICHNDVAPYNLVFRDERLVGLIDWDSASPGPRVWDLAYLAYRLVPFVADAGDPFGDDERMRRLDGLIAAYGMPFGRAEVLRVAVERLDELAAYTETQAAGTGRQELLYHAAMYRSDATRLAELAARLDPTAP